jgi:hypothetical protein
MTHDTDPPAHRLALKLLLAALGDSAFKPVTAFCDGQRRYSDRCVAGAGAGAARLPGARGLHTAYRR